LKELLQEDIRGFPRQSYAVHQLLQCLFLQLN